MIANEIASRLGLAPTSPMVRRIVRLPDWSLAGAFSLRVLNRAASFHGWGAVDAAFAASGGRYANKAKTRRLALDGRQLRDTIAQLPVARTSLERAVAESEERSA